MNKFSPRQYNKSNSTETNYLRFNFCLDVAYILCEYTNVWIFKHVESSLMVQTLFNST